MLTRTREVTSGESVATQDENAVAGLGEAGTLRDHRSRLQDIRLSETATLHLAIITQNGARINAC